MLERFFHRLDRGFNAQVATRTKETTERALDAPENKRPEALHEAIRELLEMFNMDIFGGMFYYIHYNLGLLYQKAGDLEQALDHKEEALLMHPDPQDPKLHFPIYLRGYFNSLDKFITERVEPQQGSLNPRQGQEPHQRAFVSLLKIRGRYPQLEEEINKRAARTYSLFQRLRVN